MCVNLTHARFAAGAHDALFASPLWLTFGSPFAWGGFRVGESFFFFFFSVCHVLRKTSGLNGMMNGDGTISIHGRSKRAKRSAP